MKPKKSLYIHEAWSLWYLVIHHPWEYYDADEETP